MGQPARGIRPAREMTPITHCGRNGSVSRCIETRDRRRRTPEVRRRNAQPGHGQEHWPDPLQQMGDVGAVGCVRVESQTKHITDCREQATLPRELARAIHGTPTKIPPLEKRFRPLGASEKQSRLRSPSRRDHSRRYGGGAFEPIFDIAKGRCPGIALIARASPSYPETIATIPPQIPGATTTPRASEVPPAANAHLRSRSESASATTASAATHATPNSWPEQHPERRKGGRVPSNAGGSARRVANPAGRGAASGSSTHVPLVKPGDQQIARIGRHNTRYENQSVGARGETRAEGCGPGGHAQKGLVRDEISTRCQRRGRQDGHERAVVRHGIDAGNPSVEQLGRQLPADSRDPNYPRNAPSLGYASLTEETQ
jgi:hypothetical protein